MPRVPTHEILPLILNRHSPRAMAGVPLPEEDLLRVLEAARWAPSAMNHQPWRFLVARAGTPEFAQFLEFLMPFNADWCARAGALVVVLSSTVTPDGKPYPGHAFDTGSAWMALALQASSMGLVVHPMGGILKDKIVADLQVPAQLEVQCMVALGAKGAVADLPERVRGREAPSDRRPLVESFAVGAIPESWK